MNEDLKVGAGNPGPPGASKENQDTIPSLRRQPWKWWLQVIVSILGRCSREHGRSSRRHIGDEIHLIIPGVYQSRSV